MDSVPMMAVIIVPPIHNPHFARMELIRRRQVFYILPGLGGIPLKSGCVRDFLSVFAVPRFPILAIFLGVLEYCLLFLFHFVTMRLNTP
jgi:hypothetical protein